MDQQDRQDALIPERRSFSHPSQPGHSYKLV